MGLRLGEIRDLAHRFVPGAAADDHLYTSGARSWWPAHEIGHFLVATTGECRRPRFGLDDATREEPRRYRYVVAREIAAMTISRRLLHRSGHADLADLEVQYTDMDTLDGSFERWCRRAVRGLLRRNRLVRLPSHFAGLETLLIRKAREVRTVIHARAADGRKIVPT